MVAIYKNPSATLREWAHPYRASHPDFVQGLEDVADSVEAIEAKVADLDAFDLDEVVSAATELQAVDDTLPQTVWRDDHTTHVKELVELASAFDAFATELGEPAYATHDPAERRKLMILAARRSRAFADVLDVVLVGGEGDEPDFKGFETAIRDWEPKAEAWQKWVKTYVAGLVEYREANKASRKTIADLIKNNSEFQTENTRLGNEVIALRAELDALKATPSGHNADLQDQTIKASTKASRYAFTIEQVRGVAGQLTSILSDLDKTRGA